MNRYLIVNADDFGLSEGVSRGIIAAHQSGLVTSTTFMVNFPWASQMAPLLKAAPDLGVGIHLNLTTGPTVLSPEQVPSLVDNRGVLSKSPLHLFTRVRMEEVQQEWSAQVERGIALLGRKPTHLDTHRYLQGHPAYTEVMVRVAKHYGIPAVRCLYAGPDLPLGELFGGWNPARLIATRYLQRSAGLVAESGLGCPQATVAGDFDLPTLLRRLERLQEGVTELVTHPGQVDEGLRSISSLVEQREVELQALTSPEAREKVEELDLRLVNFAHFQG